MKYQKQLIFSLFLSIGLLFSSCQKELVETIEIIPENTYQIDSQLVHLIRSMAMNDGSVDNFIDGYDCFSIAFPYEIYVDSIQINVNSQNDYVEVANVIEETGSNFNDIEIVFPITIILSDYSEVYLNSSQDIDSNLINCDAINIGIDCLDINYPLTIYVYNNELETSNSFVINNDIELFSYLSNMNEEDYISIQFPISVTTQSNEVIEVADEVMLQTLIDDCVAQEIDPNTLRDNLITDVWYVQFMYQDVDNTQNFCSYSIDFNVNGSMAASNGNDTIYGTWNIGYEEEAIYVEFIFDDEAPFNTMNARWFVNVSNPDTLGFEKSGDSGTIDLLNLDHNPTGC